MDEIIQICGKTVSNNYSYSRAFYVKLFLVMLNAHLHMQVATFSAVFIVSSISHKRKKLQNGYVKYLDNLRILESSTGCLKNTWHISYTSQK